MRPALILLGLVAVSSPLALEGITPQSAPNLAMEFQLPLPGESIPPEGGGLLVQVDSTIRQVLFHWSGPDTGSAEGQVQFDGFFQAQTGPLKPGKWVLEAQAFDAVGHLAARRSLSFNVGSSAPIAIRGEAAAKAQRVTQDFYIASNLGLKFGVAENDLQSYRSIKEVRGTDTILGPNFKPYDQVVSGNASMVYHLQQGEFRLKVRATTDASETWFHSQSPSRLGADLYWSSWAEAHLGDQYPAWSQLLMDGSRIRGVGVGMAALNDGLPVARADVAIGSLRSAIDPQIRTWDGYQDVLPSQFSRSIQAFHIGVGDGSPLGWNLTFLHSKDKTSGVDLALHDSLGGPSPRENLAIGTDIVSRLWKNRVELYFSSALGVTTDDTRQGTILDSLRDVENVPLPGFLDDISSLNLSTRGVEQLSQGPGGVGGFLWENAAMRTGGRFLIPLGELGRMRLDSRWIHVGSQFQSFARSSQENPRTGWEWSATSAVAHDAMLVVVSGSEVNTHPTMGLSIPTHTINLNLAWTPVASPFSWHAQSGTQSSGGGTETRTEAWNAGGGLFGTVASRAHGSLFWRSGYGFFQNFARIPVTSFGQDTSLPADSQITTRSYKSTVQTHSVDGSLRWRPMRDLEWRTGYMLASQGFPGDTVLSGQTQTHRLQGGASFWRLSHQLELALDGSMVLRPDQPVPDATGWDQTARVTWSGDSRTLSFTQRWARLSGGRDDLRFEAGWEAWF